MKFKIGDHIVFIDFKKVDGKYLKSRFDSKTVFIITYIDNDGNIYVSLDGKNATSIYNEKVFRMATENEIKLNIIKRKFII